MEKARKLDLRLVLGALALVWVAAAIWAAAALAGNLSSSSNDPASGNAPVAEYIQDESGRPQRGDCPADGGAGDGEAPSSSDTSSSDV
jgi:hypothetical protein